MSTPTVIDHSLLMFGLVWFGSQFMNVISMNSVRYWDPKRAGYEDIRDD